MSRQKDAQDSNPEFLRIRLFLTSNHPCYWHLKGKTEGEVRVWTAMALDYVAAQLNVAGKEENGASKVSLQVAAPTKRARGKVTPQPLKTRDAEPMKAILPIQMAEKVQDDGNYLATVSTGW